MSQAARRSRRGSVVIIALWAIAITAVLGASIQLFAYRQAMLSHDTVQRHQARWAARAGVESAIAMMALHTEQPFPDDALALIRDLEFVSAGALRDSTYDVMHHRDGFDVNGPMDDHARLNLNRGGFPLDQLMDDLSPDQAMALQDWVDPDDEAGLFGAEKDYYQATYGYEPRNGPLRSIAEMELVAGIWADYLRHEDFNLNNRLDPNENDGDLTPPEDVPDGWLDAGWSRFMSVYSVDHGATDSGLPRIHLRRAEEGELEDRCGVDAEQAKVLKAYGRHPDVNTLLALLQTPLTSITPDGTVGGAEANPDVTDLTDEQLAAVLRETRVLPLFDRQPGRVNINTAGAELIERMIEARGMPLEIAEELIFLRSGKPEGLLSELEFRELQGFEENMMPVLTEMFGTQSNVFVISARGRSEVSGAESEIIVVVDRSTLPVRILEYREQ